MKHSYTWLLFDADGTLFDFELAERTALSQTLAHFGYEATTTRLNQYRLVNTQIWRAFEEGRIQAENLSVVRFQRFFEAADIVADAGAFSTRYLENLARCSVLLDGAEAVVRKLHRSHRLMIITNGLKAVQRPRFNHSAIADCFEDIIISEEVGAAKPDVRIFEITFERMHWPSKQEVLIVGDSLSSDIRGGCNFGIDTCWFNPNGRERPEGLDVRFEIRHLQDLVALLAEP